MSPLNPPIVSRKIYAWVWIALLILLALNLGLAHINLGPFNTVAALVIPFIQMSLMILYLMHVRFNTPLTRVFVAAGFIWLVVMVDLTMSDYLTRGAVPGAYRRSWEHGTWPVPSGQEFTPDHPPSR